MSRQDRSRSERGAIAVVVAILAVTLMAVGAIAVDLGNAWARKRAVQKQVDISAIGAGWMLPMKSGNKSAIADKVVEYLNDPQNQATGQDDVTSGDLLDLDPANGEIFWENDDGSPCVNNCPQMKVLAPEAHVDFGLAGAIGFSGTDVQRTATVRVMSELPPMAKTIPFWLPNGCGFGPSEADTSGGGGGPSGAPAFGAQVAPRNVDPPVAPQPADNSIELIGTPVVTANYQGWATVSGYTVTGVPNQFQKVSLRAFKPGNPEVFIDFNVELPSNGVVPPFEIGPDDVTGTGGEWQVYVRAAKNNDKDVRFSADHRIINVIGGPSPSLTPTPTESPSASPSGSPAPSPTVPTTPTPDPTDTATALPNDCVGSDRGNFGQLYSPHTGYNNKSAAIGANIALGLDHQLVPDVFPSHVSETKDCGKHSPSIPGGKHDDTPGEAGNGANCIKADSGNDGPKMHDGFFTGIGGGVKGRLDAPTTCPGRPAISVSGVSINNDTLACFLKGSAAGNPGAIAQTTGVDTTMLDPAITKSPRFVWLPVVYATDRAQKDFQPIRTFTPAFITEETQTSGPNDSPGHINGFDINGNSIKTLHVYTFNPAALPPNEQSPTTEYDPSVGTSIVRLVG